MQQRRRSSAWIGWVLFLVIAFSARLAPPLVAWINQATGLSLSPGALIGAALLLYIAFVAVNQVFRTIQGASRSSETRLPTPTQPPRPVAPPRQPSQPPAMGRPTQLRPPNRPDSSARPPRFEPIIDPRILAFGILGLLGLGAFFFVALLLSSGLP